MSEEPTVAVVGAGFSGLLTALRLLLAPEGPRVVLIEKGPRFGRGAAYSTASPHHLLNVRATNMSALVEQPTHFLDWLRSEGVASPDKAFVTRDRYGRYLQSLLREATAEAGPRRLTLEHDAVSAIVRDGDRWSLHLAMGRTLVADAVVLALGNLSPSPPDGLDPALAASDRYVADPWTGSEPVNLGGGDVMLLGTGLTAVDVVLSLRQARPGVRIWALSRHGLLPQVHGRALPEAGVAGPPAGSPREVLAQVRRLAAIDWRGAVDSMRPHVQTLWRGWTVTERRRFLRHLRPWWNVHRHRLAPEVAARIQDLRDGGELTVSAGRVHTLTLCSDGVDVAWTARGEAEVRTRRVAQVVNCTGPRGDLTGCEDPLIAGLLASGQVRPDACRLGVDVDARSRTIGSSGQPADSLFAVGPLTRGQFYEITSVPDIRLQAADCADSILNMLALKGRASGARGGPPGSAVRLAEDLAAFIDEAIAELDIELGSLQFARRIRSAWELRGRRAALGEIALWLDERRVRGDR